MRFYFYFERSATHFLNLSELSKRHNIQFNMEFLLQLVYSSKYEVLVDFTRDYDTIRQALYNIEQFDKVCLEHMLKAAASVLLSSWGTHNYNQVGNSQQYLFQILRTSDY